MRKTVSEWWSSAAIRGEVVKSARSYRRRAIFHQREILPRFR